MKINFHLFFFFKLKIKRIIWNENFFIKFENVRNSFIAPCCRIKLIEILFKKICSIEWFYKCANWFLLLPGNETLLSPSMSASLIMSDTSSFIQYNLSFKVLILKSKQFLLYISYVFAKSCENVLEFGFINETVLVFVKNLFIKK